MKASDLNGPASHGGRFALLVVLLGVASCRPQSAEISRSPAVTQEETCSLPSCFREVASPLLEQARYHNGRDAGLLSILEIVGGGVACFDFDQDGWCDLLFPTGGSLSRSDSRVTGKPTVLMRGGPAWQWTPLPAGTRLGNDQIYTHGAITADYDHDGFEDLLVTGYPGVRLYRNQGDGSFRDVTQSTGLREAGWTTSGAWGDWNQDGHLDLYLASYVDWSFANNPVCPTTEGVPDVCSPNAFEGMEDAVFFNRANGRFDPAAALPVAPQTSKGLGVLACDLCQQGRLDVVVANDLQPNYLWHYEDGDFQENALAAGIAVDRFGNPNASMGLATLDWNLDQRFDLAVTNFENEQIALYQNDGNRLFRHVSQSAGLGRPAEAVNFGVVARDFDGDGDEDLLVAAGHVQYDPDSGTIEQRLSLYENCDGRRFRRCRQKNTEDAGFWRQPRIGRGVAAADLDRDGDSDVVVTHLEQPPLVLENQRLPQTSWLRLRLVGRESPRTPIGATAWLRVAERQMIRQVYGGGSYLSQSENILSWGWPEQAAADLTVHWPSGAVSQLRGLSPNQEVTLVEPRPQRD